MRAVFLEPGFDPRITKFFALIRLDAEGPTRGGLTANGL